MISLCCSISVRPPDGPLSGQVPTAEKIKSAIVAIMIFILFPFGTFRLPIYWEVRVLLTATHLDRQLDMLPHID